LLKQKWAAEWLAQSIGGSAHEQPIR